MLIERNKTDLEIFVYQFRPDFKELWDVKENWKDCDGTDEQPKRPLRQKLVGPEIQAKGLWLWLSCSVTSKKSPNVYKSCRKMISLEK